MKILNETIEHLQNDFATKTELAKKLFSENSLLKIEVKQEELIDCYDPRQFDNIGTMACFHKRYNLGDGNKHNFKSEQFNSFGELKEAIINEVGTNAIILPLYLYDHSGITISTKPFSCGFDSGQIGFIYAMRNSEGMTVEQITNNLEKEVELYDKYLRGEIYSYYIINQVTGEFVESCGGFYSEKEAQEAAKEALNNITN